MIIELVEPQTHKLCSAFDTPPPKACYCHAFGLQGLLELAAAHLAPAVANEDQGNSWGPGASATAASLATALVEADYMPIASTQGATLPVHSSLLHASAAAACALTAAASHHDQHGVALAAAATVAVSSSQPSSASHAAAAVVACACLCALRPGVLSASNSVGSSQLQESLLSLAKSRGLAHTAPVLQAALQQAVGVALGSMLNKWEDQEQADEVSAGAVAALSAGASGCAHVNSSSLAWLARGLVLRGSPIGAQLARQAMSQLAHTPLPCGDGPGDVDVEGAQRAAACASCLRVVLAPDSFTCTSTSLISSSAQSTAVHPPYGLGLGRRWHCNVRVLWHQRILTECLQPCLAMSEQAGVSNTAQKLSTSPGVLLGLGILAGLAPEPLLQPHLPFLISHLAMATSVLSKLAGVLNTSGKSCCNSGVTLLQAEVHGALTSVGQVLSRALADAGASGASSSVLRSALEGASEDMVSGLCAMAGVKVDIGCLHDPYWRKPCLQHFLKITCCVRQL